MAAKRGQYVWTMGTSEVRGAGSTDHVVEHLPTKCKLLGSIPSAICRGWGREYSGKRSGENQKRAAAQNPLNSRE
jgi:hypothetical protein